MLKVSEKKNKCLVDVLTLDDPELTEGILYHDPGYGSHKVAKCQSNDDTLYESYFRLFERTWSALHSYNAMQDPKEDVILEMGCADMATYNAYKSLMLYPNYIGVDIRKDYLSASIHKDRKDVLGLCADLSKPLPIKSGTVSAVVLSEVVEHLTFEQNLVFFSEAFRLLKPGGKVLVSSPVNTNDREFHSLEKEKNLGHVFFWKAEQFETEMRKIGFGEVDLKWGFSVSSKIRAEEIQKTLHPAVQVYLSSIKEMYGSSVARALTLSVPNVPNGGCRFTLTK